MLFEKEMAAIRLELPVSPSANNLFMNPRGGGRRPRTPAYKAWQEAAGWQARAQLVGCIIQHLGGPVAMLIEAPFGRDRDMDNIKPIGDLLTHLGIIDDDCWIDELRIVRVAQGGRMGVWLWPLG